MKIFNVLCYSMALLLMSTAPCAHGEEAMVTSSSTGRGFAVVELFTSEGCSSCPVADQFLRSLTQEARQKKLPIYTLGFHVDYWNYLGWVDQFSDERYTQRQKRYAASRRSREIYTPQLIINGQHAMGGYKQELARNIIQESLQRNVDMEISLKVKATSSDLHVDYSFSKNALGYDFNIAVVQGNIQTNVQRGENAGRTLRHANAVRVFRIIPIKEQEGSVTVSIPDNVDMKQSSLIAYIQDKKTMLIPTATGLDLNIFVKKI